MHKKGRELGQNNVVAKEPYTKWIKEKVQQIKLSFILDPLYCPNSPISVHISVEEVNELKAPVARLVPEKEELQQSLYLVSYERSKMKFELIQKDKQLYKSKEKAEIERGKRKRTLGGILNIIFNLDNLNQQLDTTRKEGVIGKVLGNRLRGREKN